MGKAHKKMQNTKLICNITFMIIDQFNNCSITFMTNNKKNNIIAICLIITPFFLFHNMICIYFILGLILN